MNQKGFAPILIVVLIAVASVGGLLIYQQSRSQSTPSPSPEAIYCTKDAKLCPDGTSVGRVGPTCEFAPCPTPYESTSSAETANWKIYIDTYSGIEFKYPPEWTEKEQGLTQCGGDFRIPTVLPVAAFCPNESIITVEVVTTEPISEKSWVVRDFAGTVEDVKSNLSRFNPKIENIKVGGKEAIRFDYMDWSKMTLILVKGSSKALYRIEFSGTKDAALDSSFNQFLSTFKFTN